MLSVDCYYVETSVSQSVRWGLASRTGLSVEYKILKTFITQAAVQYQADHRHEETQTLHAKWSEIRPEEASQRRPGSGQAISEEKPKLLLG